MSDDLCDELLALLLRNFRIILGDSFIDDERSTGSPSTFEFRFCDRELF